MVRSSEWVSKLESGSMRIWWWTSRCTTTVFAAAHKLAFAFKCRSVAGFICANWAHLAAFASSLHLTLAQRGYFWETRNLNSNSQMTHDRRLRRQRWGRGKQFVDLSIYLSRVDAVCETKLQLKTRLFTYQFVVRVSLFTARKLATFSLQSSLFARELRNSFQFYPWILSLSLSLSFSLATKLTSATLFRVKSNSSRKFGLKLSFHVEATNLNLGTISLLAKHARRHNCLQYWPRTMKSSNFRPSTSSNNTSQTPKSHCISFRSIFKSSKLFRHRVASHSWN